MQPLLSQTKPSGPSFIARRSQFTRGICPFLFLYHYTWFWATSDKVQGFKPYPDGIIRPQGISLSP
jgi:hypothetical protein